MAVNIHVFVYIIMPVFSCALLLNYPLEVTDCSRSKEQNSYSPTGRRRETENFVPLPKIEAIFVGLLLTAQSVTTLAEFVLVRLC